MASNGQEDLTEYEKLWRRNIKDRESLYQDVMKAKAVVKKAFARKKVVYNRINNGLPSRKSRRLLKEYIPQLEKGAPIPLQTLDFKSIFDHGFDDERLWEGGQFFTQFCQELFEQQETKEQIHKEHRSSKIDFPSNLTASITEDQIKSVCIHPTDRKILAGAGTTQGDLVLWDITENYADEGCQLNPSTYKFRPHFSVINCQSWDKYKNENLITSSSDGTCRILDLNRMESRLLFGNKDFMSLYTENRGNLNHEFKKNTCDMHQQVTANEFLISMGRTGCIGLVDQRVGHESTVQEYQVFDGKSAQNISVHPLQNNLVLAANNVGRGVVFDRRNLPDNEDGCLEPIAELVGHEGSITSAAFNSSGNRLATMCWDNKLRLFDSTIIKGSLKVSSVDHPTCKKDVSIGRGVWHPIHEDIYYACCPSQKQLQAYRASSVMNQIRTYQGLQGSDSRAACTVLAAHPSLDILVGAGGKQVQVFMNVYPLTGWPLYTKF